MLKSFLQPSPRQTLETLKVGLAAGTLCVLYLIIVAFLGKNPLGFYAYLIPPVYGVVMGYAYWSYREGNPMRRLTMRQGLALGFFSNLFATFVFTLVLYLFLTYSGIGAETVALHKKDLLALLDKAKEMKVEDVDKIYEETKVNIANLDTWTLTKEKALLLHIVGLFITLIMSLIFRHNPPSTEQ